LAKQRAEEEKAYQQKIKERTDELRELRERYSLITRGNKGSEPSFFTTEEAFRGHQEDLLSRLRDAGVPGPSIQVERRPASTVWVFLEGQLTAAAAGRFVASLRAALTRRKERVVLDLARLAGLEDGAVSELVAGLGGYRDRIRIILPRVGEVAALAASFPLYLVNWKEASHTHTRSQNNPLLVAIKSSNPLVINPATAERMGVATGDEVILESPNGSVRAVAEVSARIHPEVVGLQHGFGHRALGRVAKGRGTAISDLNTMRYDPLAGQACHKEICVRVTKA